MKVKIQLDSFDTGTEASATAYTVDDTPQVLATVRFDFIYTSSEGGDYMHKVTIEPNFDGGGLPFYTQTKIADLAANMIDDAINEGGPTIQEFDI